MDRILSLDYDSTFIEADFVFILFRCLSNDVVNLDLSSIILNPC